MGHVDYSRVARHSSFFLPVSGPPHLGENVSPVIYSCGIPYVIDIKWFTIIVIDMLNPSRGSPGKVA
jgi:hypothetical protein